MGNQGGSDRVLGEGMGGCQKVGMREKSGHLEDERWLPGGGREVSRSLICVFGKELINWTTFTNKVISLKSMDLCLLSKKSHLGTLILTMYAKN